LATRYRFRVLDVKKACRYRAAFYSVLVPLFGASSVSSAEAISDAFDALRDLWRRRLPQMLKAKWYPVARSKTAYSYVSNCPPFGVVTADKSFCCGHPLVCPFCFGRVVTDSFMYLERAAWGGYRPRTAGGRMVQPLEADLETVGFSFLHPRRPSDEAWKPERRAAQVSRVLRAEVRNPALRTFERKHFKARYGVLTHRIWPDRRNSCVQCIRQGVLLTANAHRVDGPLADEYRKAGGRLHRDRLTKLALAQQMGRSFRYSPAMLKARASDVVSLVEALGRVRLMSRFGPYRLRDGLKSAFEEPFDAAEEETDPQDAGTP